MRKIISPVKCHTFASNGRPQFVRAFCSITFEGGDLSIFGVVGPKANGNCLGSAGQCTDSIRAGKAITDDGWTPEMVQKFCDIWDRWHLNNMNPCCEHQRKLGWMEQAREPMTLYHYKLRPQAAAEQKRAEKAALQSLREGKTFTPDRKQVFYANLKYFLDKYDPVAGELAEFYEPYKSGLYGAEETKTRGWVDFSEDDRGILCKPCPVCGYKYGTSWLKEEVPQDVIEWLFALPDTPVNPAWI